MQLEPTKTNEPAVPKAERFWGPLSRRAAYVLLLCLTISGSTIGLGLAVVLLNRPTGVGRREVIVQRGMTVAQIARLLHDEGLIRSPKLLELFSLLNGTSRRLTAGLHPFHGRMSTWRVLQELEVPRDVTRDITIPEGLRREQVVRVLADSLDLDEAKLLQLTAAPDFCRKLGVEANNLEGYLFPETYRLSLMIDEKQAVGVLVSHFFKVFDREKLSRAQEIGMSMHEVVTLASIIEGEVQVDQERPVVSAVYHNRLKRRMRLQADPTVQYALEDGPRRLFYRDYEIDSPYNTYRHRGLPPGPIMSPGAASLKAALYPADVDYLYFVARGDGSHIFSRTAKEHEQAKRETRWARRRSWQASKTR